MQSQTNGMTVADSVGWRELRAGLAEILRGLADWQLRTLITTSLAPFIYVVCATGVVALNAYLAIAAFRDSFVSGLLWLFLVLPIGSIAGLVIVRVVLESLLTLFRMAMNMEVLMEQLHTLRGQTETIADRVDDLPLPRIQFWRSRSRRGSASDEAGA